MLVRQKVRSKELAEKVGISEQNLSLLKSGKVKRCVFRPSKPFAITCNVGLENCSNTDRWKRGYLSACSATPGGMAEKSDGRYGIGADDVR